MSKKTKVITSNVQPNPKEAEIWNKVNKDGSREVKQYNNRTGKFECCGGSSSGSGSGETSKQRWTGHADVEGLRAIGWTDEDIVYYQANGVNWNKEDDQYHLVSDDNKALYGVLTADNIQDYKDRIVYLPKIDTSGKTDMNNMFNNCSSLVFIPKLDTQNVIDMNSMFKGCGSLIGIPYLNT